MKHCLPVPPTPAARARSATLAFALALLAGGIVKAFGYQANFFGMAGILVLGAVLTALWRLTGPRSST